LRTLCKLCTQGGLQRRVPAVAAKRLVEQVLRNTYSSL